MSAAGFDALALSDRLRAPGTDAVPRADARSRRLRLTRVGRNRAKAVLAARRTAMSEALEALSATDRRELERLLDVVVGRLAETRLPALQVCRLCDRTACASNGRDCPLGHTVAGGGTDG